MTFNNSSTWDPAAACSALSNSLNLPNATVLAADYLLLGANITLLNHSSLCELDGELPEYTIATPICRVQINVTTSEDSSIYVETWLPDEWYGRYLATGNAGLNGCLNWNDMLSGTTQHFATSSTNNGHIGDTGEPFLGHKEVIKDFVYRSIDVQTTIGKTITKAYYESEIRASYYTGSSSGGRQGFKAVQDFPDVFDGLAIGRPAIDWNGLGGLDSKVEVALKITGDSVPLLSEDDLDLITEDVLNTCDELDGVKDGIIDDPSACDYNPEGLLCGGDYSESSNSTGCLSQEKVDAVKVLYSPLTSPNGTVLYPRHDLGMTGSTPRYLFGPQPFWVLSEWYAYAVFSDPTYTLANWTFKDYEAAVALDPYNISTINPDIHEFRDSGHKIISYHGTQDQIFPSARTVQYYNEVSEFLEMPLESLQNFWRHFQIPGNGHGSSGPGAWQFAQSDSTLDGITNSSDSNVLLALVEWVEGGKAPDGIVGTKFTNDTAALGVQAQRLHCPYPQKSVWNGVGDTNKASSWECK